MLYIFLVQIEDLLLTLSTIMNGVGVHSTKSLALTVFERTLELKIH